MKNIIKIISLLSLVNLITVTCYHSQQEKKEIREALELCHENLQQFKQTIQTKKPQTVERDLKLLHTKAISLQKEALPVSASLEFRCNDLIDIIDELIKAQSTKQNTQLFPID